MKTDTIKNTGLCRRALSPFDDSATERRRRMGLVSETGEPDQNSIEVLSHGPDRGAFYQRICPGGAV